METLRMLEKHLALRPFLFGQRPSLADFGLAGQLYQCLDRGNGEPMITNNSQPIRASLWFTMFHCELMVTT